MDRGVDDVGSRTERTAGYGSHCGIFLDHFDDRCCGGMDGLS